MKVRSNILFVEGEAVRCVALKIIPDLFNRVEFGCIAWKPFYMKTGIFNKDLLYDWPFMDLRFVPQKDYMALDMSEESL